jgi:hypothetical protein
MAMKKGSARRGRERRGSERADARLSMRVEAGATGAARIVTESQNISSSGVYCHASHYLAPLSKVQLTIVLPRTPGATAVGQELVKCDGIVVRCDQRQGDRTEMPYELACMFTGLDADLRRRVEEFVTWRNLQALRAALAPQAKSMKPVRPAARPAVKKSVPRKTAPRKAARTRAAGSASARNGASPRTAARAAKPAAGKES